MFRRFSDEVSRTSPVAGAGAAAPGSSVRPMASATDTERGVPAGRPIDFTDLKVRFHQRLLDMLNLPVLDKVPIADLRREVSTLVRELLIEAGIALNAKECTQLVEEILNEVLGLGPIEPLLKDDTVSDILVNTHAQVFVERAGQLELTPVRFKDHQHLIRIIDKIVSRVGRRIDESQPWVDARLPDGSRVNAIIPPCAVDGPLLSIRKFARIPFTIERLIENGTMTAEVAELLKGIVQSRLNILISGGTGTGKTTFLNALST